MKKTTLKELAIEAVRATNAQKAIRVADACRRFGLDYQGTFEAVNAWTGVELAEWEALLYEGDWASEQPRRPHHAW